MVEDYYTNPAISQSQLKLLLGPDPSIFNTIQEPDLYFEEKKHFIIGNGVDMQLTRPIEEFNQKFHISNLQNKPSDTIKSIVNQVYDHVKEVYSNIRTIQNYSDAILDACNDHNYQFNWKDSTRIAKIVEAWEYWEDLKAAEGKVVLSQEENDLISQIVMSIRTNPTTSKYFETSKDVEILDQLAIYFSYCGIDCKALLDRVIIDHINKTIQPIDFKTMGDQTIYFPKSLRQRRYDIQNAFYTEALYYFKERDESNWKDYKILPFKFIVESTVNPGNPLVFTCSNELLFMGRWGREENFLELNVPDSAETWTKKEYVSYLEIKGFHQLIEDYKWYMEKGFETKREIVESQGEFQLDWNGII
jgi:hypothetical protein